MMNDLISRQAAIEAIVNTPSRVCDNKTLYNKYDGAAFRQQEIINTILILPSSVPTQDQHIPSGGWIPVTERLPKARESVILSTKNWTGEGCYWETTEHHVIWKGYRWNATYWEDEVVAWMPLPKPYTTQSNDSKALDSLEGVSDGP